MSWSIWLWLPHRKVVWGYGTLPGDCKNIANRLKKDVLRVKTLEMRFLP